MIILYLPVGYLPVDYLLIGYLPVDYLLIGYLPVVYLSFVYIHYIALIHLNYLFRVKFFYLDLILLLVYLIYDYLLEY